jgi:hypothetical protein
MAIGGEAGHRMNAGSKSTPTTLVDRLVPETAFPAHKKTAEEEA